MRAVAEAADHKRCAGRGEAPCDGEASGRNASESALSKKKGRSPTPTPPQSKVQRGETTAGYCRRSLKSKTTVKIENGSMPQCLSIYKTIFRLRQPDKAFLGRDFEDLYRILNLPKNIYVFKYTNIKCHAFPTITCHMIF